MNAILLTVLALGGADSAAFFGGGQPTGGGGYVGGDGYDQCDDCNNGGGGHHQGCGNRGGWLGNMPQSCYNPSFGCYPSTRYMHRYPAFAGYYYRKAYNYRTYFDYPWHAGLHEPTSMFSYHVPGEVPAGAAPPPQPVPDAARLPQAQPLRTAAAAEEVGPATSSVLSVTPYKIQR
jgi:hypothetical protein